MEPNVRRMETILLRTNCPKHKVPKGIPCWHIKKNVLTPPGVENLDFYAAACGGRIKRAGFKAPISLKSVNRGNPNGLYQGNARVPQEGVRRS